MIGADGAVPARLLAPIQRLLHRYGLEDATEIVPLSGGQLNHVLKINARYVLRYREAPFASGSLRREACVLQWVRGAAPAPESLGAGVDDILGEYHLQTALPGESLLTAWLSNPEVSTREWWMQQWVECIRAIHGVRFENPGEIRHDGLHPSPNWRAYVEGRIRSRVDRLLRQAGADRELALASERFMRRRAAVLVDGPFGLIHRDLHFGNVLVDGPKLTAILDFELAEVGPPDYELDTIYRFLSYPWLYVEPALAQRTTPTRFASVWPRLRRGYPELFTIPHLRERLSLYALDQALSRLLQSFSGGWDGQAIRPAIVEHIGAILRDEYGHL